MGLLLPAAVMLLFGYLVPSVWTVWASFHEVDILSDTRTWVGMDNYLTLSPAEYLRSFGFAALMTLLPIATVALVALVIAFLAERGGRPTRWAVRLALVLPMVAFAPTAFAAGWLLDRVGTGATDPLGAATTILAAVALTMFGALVGIGVTAYLAALNRRAPTRPGLAALVVGIVAAISTFAIGLQLFAYPFVLTRGGPERSTATPLVAMFDAGFRAFHLGLGAALATGLLVVLAGLGVLAVLIAIASRLRIEVVPRGPEPPGRAEAAIGAIAGLVIVLGITGYALWPWLRRLFDFQADGPGAVIANTWLPPLISTVFGIVVAALAGFGIGALRPLGRFSPALLLLFAPWLFVGDGVHGVYHYQRLVEQDAVGTYWSLIPAGWLVVPAVVVFALLFQGQQARWRELRAAGVGTGPATMRALILPALPMVLLATMATWLVRAQSLFWNLLVSPDPERWSGPTHLVVQLGALASDAPGMGLVLPFAMILVFGAGLAVLQLSYLDRLVIRTGTPRPALPPPPA